MSSASAASSRSAASASAAAAASRTTQPTTVTASGGITQPSFTTGANGSRTPITASQPSATGTASPSGSVPPGTVQSGTGSSNFPHWAIAVIVILGFLALVASGMLSFFIVRRIRAQRAGILSNRGSMGSSTPMMANAQPTSPLLGPGASAALAGAAGAGAGAMLVGGSTLNRPQTPLDTHDGASTLSSDAAFLSGADAAIMADAFRKALRKPDFADRPVEEGESPDNGHGTETGELLNQELAEEGRDIRSVSSSRGVRVETLSDEDATAHDNPH